MIEDGGPASPGYWENDTEGNATAPDGQVVPPMTQHGMPGMSLRDYFAAKAMQSLLAAYLSPEYPPGLGAEKLTDTAYSVADNMLRARSK